MYTSSIIRGRLGTGRDMCILLQSLDTPVLIKVPQIRPVAVGWQMPRLGNKMTAFCHPWELFCIFYCCFVLSAKEVLLKFWLSSILESTIFSCRRIIHLIVIT